MRSLIIIGAGGHAKDTLQLIKDINTVSPKWNVLGFVDDDKSKTGSTLLGFSVLGTLDFLKGVSERELHIVIAIGSSAHRASIIKRLEPLHLHYASLIHPTAWVGEAVEIGVGSCIFAYSVISPGASIGRFCIVHNGTIVGHDCEVADVATLLPGCRLSGGVAIGEEAELGTSVTIIPNMKVGQKSILGAGSVVVKNIPEHCTAVGVPARPIKYHDMNGENAK